ncbi:MAG TPA: 50S ribosomal protein L35 [Phycisphaerae bacterium]|nr:50S ribosomal protein L35 [Phycisphaerae bacterium]
MPKMKRHKGLAKRVRVTANGKVKYKQGNAGHLMSGKSGNRKQKLRGRATLNNPPLAKRIIRALQA